MPCAIPRPFGQSSYRQVIPLAAVSEGGGGGQKKKEGREMMLNSLESIAKHPAADENILLFRMRRPPPPLHRAAFGTTDDTTAVASGRGGRRRRVVGKSACGSPIRPRVSLVSYVIGEREEGGGDDSRMQMHLRPRPDVRQHRSRTVISDGRSPSF